MLHDYLISASEISNHITCVCFIKGCKGICPYCYNRELWKYNKNEYKYTKEDVLHEIKNSNQRYKLITALSVTGAEPLLRIDEVCDFVKFIKTNYNDLYINIDTSLTQGKLNVHLLNYVDKFSISIKSYWNEDLDNVLYNLEILEHFQKDIEIRMVLTKTNVYPLFDILNSHIFSLEKINIKTFKVSCAIENHENRGHFIPLSIYDYQQTFDELQNVILSKFKGVQNVINGTKV